MPSFRRPRPRFASGSPPRDPASRRSRDPRARVVAVIALVLAVLLPLQIASATMARLLRPAHVHVGLPAVVDGSAGAAVIAMTARLPDPGLASAASRVSALAIEATQPPPSGSASTRTAAHGHDHPHAHPHPDSHTHTHAGRHAAQPPDHGHAHRKIHSHAASPSSDSVAHRAEPSAPAHTATPDAATAAHARAHAAGIGHHRHAPDSTGVVYVDDGASPQTPGAPATRTADVTVMLLPASPWWLGNNVGSDRLPNAPLHVLAAHYALPGDRPPR